MFLDIRNEIHWRLLLYFASAWQETFGPQSPDVLRKLSEQDQRLSRNIQRLGMISAKTLREMFARRRSAHLHSMGGRSIRRLVATIPTLTPGAPYFLEQTANDYLQALSLWFSINEMPQASRLAAFKLIETYLTTPKGRFGIYKALVTRFFSSSALIDVQYPLSSMAPILDHKTFVHAFLQVVEEDSSNPPSSEASLWRLAYFLYLAQPTSASSIAQEPSLTGIRIRCLALLLARCSEQISMQYDIGGQQLNGTTSPSSRLPTFVSQRVDSLPTESSVTTIMAALSGRDHSREVVANGINAETLAASDMAKFAVALLRAFPSKAVNVRKWLYQGGTTSARGMKASNVPAIDFFWKAAQNTNVFQGIYGNQAEVLTLLKQPALDHDQIGRSRPSKLTEEIWRDEWQVILLFFELYNHVLKPMDDETFFGHATFGTQQSTSTRGGALPLNDIAVMCTFLKNMAFTLYWSAADLEDSNAFENAGGLSAYFGTHERAPRKSDAHQQPQSLAGIEGMSQAYLKGVVTGILRMVHERDSRRPFLPKDFWLMTTHVDMAAFISGVVAEEERRHEEPNDEEEDVDRWQEIFDAEDDLHAVPMDRPYLNFARDSRTAQIRREEHVERKREISRRKRMRESLAPRMEILRNLPFFVPFETRVQIFREFIKQDQLRRRDGHIDPDTWRMHTAMGGSRGLGNMQAGHNRVAAHRAEVRRESIFQDAFDAFYPLNESLKEPIQISFIDKFGNAEAGIDGGGVTKEFLISITNEVFDPKSELAMFAENEQHEIYPNPTAFESTLEILRRLGIRNGSDEHRSHLRQFWQQFEFLGRIMGKCIYEGILVDIHFAGFFLLKWALSGGSTAASNESAYRASINDVKDYDQALYQGLVALKNYTGDVENDFGLNFSVTDTMPLVLNGTEITHTVTIDLLPGGSDLPVTKTNRDAYIDLIARWRLQRQPQIVTDAFLRGLGQIVQPMWLAMFNQKELQTLVGGENSELDLADLRRNTQYNGLYQIGDDGREHPTIALFWKVLKEMDDEDRRKILKFVTSTPRAPLLGFANLTPPFTIHSTSAAEGTERLPSTSTCVNLLKLPNYRDETTMRAKLLYAANSGAGFDLS